MAFTQVVRYEIDPTKRAEFLEWARAWIVLITKYGGTHLGYFVPPGEGDVVPVATLSHAVGSDGPPNIAYAIFSFPDIPTYEAYRRDVEKDPDCDAATALKKRTGCFIRYERNFLVHVPE